MYYSPREALGFEVDESLAEEMGLAEEFKLYRPVTLVAGAHITRCPCYRLSAPLSWCICTYNPKNAWWEK
jgi:hypothetical protein